MQEGEIIPPNFKGHKHTNESLKKMSESAKKQLNVSGRFEKGHKPYYSFEGKHHSESAKKKLSESSKIHNPKYWLGKKLSEETKKKLSVSRKGMLPWNTGKHHSKETCAKISNLLKGRMVGEKHPNWMGGISFEPYCHKFNDRLKEQIRERDNRTCQLCGTKENGRKLDVHHIHYDKPNCGPDLISLCTSCNTKANFDREYYERLFMQKLKEQDGGWAFKSESP